MSDKDPDHTIAFIPGFTNPSQGISVFSNVKNKNKRKIETQNRESIERYKIK